MQPFRFILLLFLSLFCIALFSQESFLKSVIYDFDGLNIGQTALPDGDYRNNDLSYQVAANPLGESDMLGDRVLALNLNWTAVGHGEFGKGTFRFFELDAAADYINFYVYNPFINTADANAEIIIIEDDDKNNISDPTKDDIWKKDIIIQRKEGWQLISIPLITFLNDNEGGNNIFDAGYTDGAGMIFQIGIKFKRINTNSSSETIYIDMICFSEGALITGANILDLPNSNKGNGCRLGAYNSNSDSSMDLVPNDIENLFPNSLNKKIKYVNQFLPFSTNGQPHPNKFPGNDVKTLLNNGYTPVITWEPLYAHLARLDPVQPKLQDIVNGSFDAYIAEFAEVLKGFDDTIIIRLMHEFEGDWYPWSLTHNNQDPALYIAAFRRFVNICREKGALKVQWMWCVNSDPSPYTAYNWIIPAYPGDEYVDFVATDIYNHPDPGIPDWKSFRYTGIEPYYYLTKYFPQKPFIICEVASRERYNGEPVESETKSDWIKQMDKEMQSFFYRTIGLIFFTQIKEHDWRINSSQGVLQTVDENIWQDEYYFKDPTFISSQKKNNFFTVYPNPSGNEFSLLTTVKPANKTEVFIYSYTGSIVFYTSADQLNQVVFGKNLIPGVYFVKASNEINNQVVKIVKL